jgi:hypothetical protein
MSAPTVASVWRVPREADVFVGPIAVTVTADGSPVDNATVQFAVMTPSTARPVEADWIDPILDPSDPTKIGVWAPPVETEQRSGIWVRIPDSPETDVLDPSQVGWLVRT